MTTTFWAVKSSFIKRRSEPHDMRRRRASVAKRAESWTVTDAFWQRVEALIPPRVTEVAPLV
jgi:hypothetical protein